VTDPRPDRHPPVIVCLDPGHPSEVGRGARGRHLTEITAAWQVALRTKRFLERAGIRAVLTKRRESQFVANRARAEIANRAGAALMVRLHGDSEGGSGFAVYVPDRAGLSGGVRGPSPAVLRSSHIAGRAFHAALSPHLQGLLSDRGLHPDTATAVGSRQGALTGSVFSHVPVVLIEMGVLTNPRDEAVLASESGQERMAGAIAAATRAALAALRGAAPK